MCYEERLLRSWTTKKAQQGDKDQRVSELDRPHLLPIRTTPAPEAKHPKEVEREIEEIV